MIASITDSVDNGRSATYSYDSLYRLSTAVTTGSASYPGWGLQEAYDRYGNRTSQTAISGCTGITCPQPSVSVNATTNRITGSGYSYDASGSMTNDGPSMNTIVYDAENHAVSSTNGSSSGTYTYDGNGLRVKKVSGSTTTVYIFSGSKVIAEYDNGAAVGSPSREYIYGGTALLAKIAGSATTYYHQDHLSNRLVTSSTGTVVAQMGHFPFGETWYNSTNDKLFFTTYERDQESGNDYAIARLDISRLARFSSVDPLFGSISDPQSLNRYEYVENDVANATDPLGLYLVCFGGDTYDEVDFFTDTGAGPEYAGSDYTFIQHGCTIPRGGGGGSRGGNSGGGRPGVWNSVKNTARKIGDYIPLICSGGVYNSAGVGTSGLVSVGISPHFQQTDFGLSQGKLYATYSEGVFAEATVGEVIQGGVGQAYTYGKGQTLADSKTTETFLFGGVGASTPYVGANASAFYATPSSFGISLSGNLLAFQGGVGAYVNVSSVTSCFGF